MAVVDLGQLINLTSTADVSARVRKIVTAWKPAESKLTISSTASVKAKTIKMTRSPKSQITVTASVSANARRMPTIKSSIATSSEVTVKDFWKYKTIKAQLQGTASVEMYQYPDRDINLSMTGYLPRYYDSSQTVFSGIRTEANEFTRYQALILEVLNQFFVDTATWGLDHWERSMAIPNGASTMTIEQRRDRIKKRKEGYGTMTYSKFKALANEFMPCDVIENKGEFEVILELLDVRSDDEVPDTFDAMMEFLYAIIPAHLRIVTKFKEVDWDEIDQKSQAVWGDLEDHTYEALSKYYYFNGRWIHGDATDPAGSDSWSVHTFTEIEQDIWQNYGLVIKTKKT